jgi:hypothetical protein
MPWDSAIQSVNRDAAYPNWRKKHITYLKIPGITNQEEEKKISALYFTNISGSKNVKRHHTIQILLACF